MKLISTIFGEIFINTLSLYTDAYGRLNRKIGSKG